MRHSLTPEERRERLDTAHGEMVAAVEAIASGDDWRRFLEFSRTLPSYSAQNRAWLFFQAMMRGWDDVGAVAGYRAWQAMGRQVRKGETSLRVLAPLRAKVRDEDGEERWIVRGFTTAAVFAACQTDGDEIPTPIRPELLTGEAEGWDALSRLVEARGFTVVRAGLFPANGTTSFTTRVVTIADRLEPAAAVKTLTHELAHVLLHEDADHHANRGRCEVEAESVAYLVCRELDIVSDQYSFPYVATWAGGDTRMVTAAADRALTCAAEVLAALESTRELVAA